MYKCKSSEDSKCYLKVFSTYSIKNTWLEWKENPNEDYWVVGLWWMERYNSCYNDPAGCGSDVIYKQQLTGCVTCPTQNWVCFVFLIFYGRKTSDSLFPLQQKTFFYGQASNLSSLVVPPPL